VAARIVIRSAIFADIPAVIDQVEALAASVRGPQRVCRLRTGETLARLITGADGAVFVSGGGFIAGQMWQTVINTEPVAVELGWYAADRSGLRLLRTFEAWASDHGAVLVKMSANGGAGQRILERVGYGPAETQMIKRLQS